MSTAMRVCVSVAIVVAAVGVWIVLDPTTCDGDICQSNLVAGFGIVLMGFVAAAAFLRLTATSRDR